MIEAGYLQAVHLRPWPKIVCGLGPVAGDAGTVRPAPAGDLCWLYYNQPCRHRRFLALKYIVSSRGGDFSHVPQCLW